MYECGWLLSIGKISLSKSIFTLAQDPCLFSIFTKFWHSICKITDKQLPIQDIGFNGYHLLPLSCFTSLLCAELCKTYNEELTSQFVERFYSTKHAILDCLDCHEAQAGDSEGFVHFDVIIVEVRGRSCCNYCHIGF